MTAGDFLALGLYLAQQLGVMLSVGAATIMLIAHLVATRDGVVEESEARFARAIERVLMVGLFCVVASGVAITALHSLSGQAAVVFSAAYIFKWLLIGVVTLPLIVGHKHPFPPLMFEGFVGGTWFALFILHVVAPITTWTDLFLLYAIWMVAFMLLWSTVVRLVHAKNPPKVVKKNPTPKLDLKPFINSIFAAPPKPLVPAPSPTPTMPKIEAVATPPPAPPPPPPPKPVVVAATPPPKPTPLPLKPTPTPPPPKPVLPVKPALALPTKPPIKPPPPKPKEAPADEVEKSDLPTIRVMPRTLEDIQKQDRASIVQFG